MKIQLIQADIEEALKDYIEKYGIDLQNSSVDMAFTAKRKNKGITVTLDIQQPESVSSNEEESSVISESFQRNAVKEEKVEDQQQEEEEQTPSKLFSS